MPLETILVVEDEQIVASDLKMILEGLKYKVAPPLATAEEALAQISDIRPDLVLMDIVLAGPMDGVEAAEQIRARFEIPVIFLTAYADQKTLDRAKITEPFGYIIKPFDEPELRSTLTMALFKHKFDKQLRESERKYRALIENTLDVAYSCDASGMLTYISPQVEMYGFVAEEMVGRSLFDLIDPEDHDHIQAELASMIQKGEEVPSSFRFRDKKGQVFWMEERGKIQRDTDGNMIGFNGVLRDVTQQKLAEEALRKSEMQLSNAVNLARLGPWEYDVAQDLFTFNDHFYAIFRTTAEEAGGYTMSSSEYAKRFLHPDDLPLVGIETRKAIETTDPNYSSDLEHRIVYADGEVGYITVRIFVVKDSRGRTVKTYGVNQDITERKRIEVELQKHQKQLEEAQRIGRIGSWEWDAASNNATCSNELYRILNIDRNISKFTVETFMSTPHPDDRAMVQKIVMRSIETHEPTDFSFRRIAKNGELRWLHARSSTVMDDDGKLKKVLGTLQDITERKLAEEALKKSEARFRSYFELSIAGIAITSPTASWIEMNDYLCEMLGYSREELRQTTWSELTHPDDLDKDLEYFNRVLAGEMDSYFFDKRFICKNGKIIWTSMSVRCVRLDDGKVDYFVALLFDITARKQAEEALTQEQYLMNMLMDNVPDHIYFKDKDSRFIRTNKDHAKKFGLSDPSQVVGKTDFDFFAEEHARPAFEDEQTIIRTGKPILNIEEKETWPDGRETWVSTTKMPLRDKEANIIGTFGVSRDITERKRAEEALRLAHEDLKNLHDNLDEAIFSLDTVQNKMLQVSVAHEAVFGHSRAEFLKNPNLWYEQVLPEDRAIVDAGNPVLMLGKSLQHEIRIVRPDGQIRWIEAKLKPTLDENGRLVHIDGIVSDITERKRAEEALEKASQELKNHVSELEQFAYIASHDLQEPIRQVASFARLLERRYTGRFGQEADDYAGFIYDGALRMQAMVDDMRGYFDLLTEKHPFEKVALKQLFEKVLHEMKGAIQESGAHISRPELPEVNGDPHQIHQLFRHLLDNAIKFRGSKPLDIQVRCKLQDAEWVFSVQDNGIGVAPEYHEMIFKLFKKLYPRDRYTGSGIGLAICKKVVEHHGGRIWIASKPDQGTTVFFTIPVSESHPR